MDRDRSGRAASATSRHIQICKRSLARAQKNSPCERMPDVDVFEVVLSLDVLDNVRERPEPL